MWRAQTVAPGGNKGRPNPSQDGKEKKPHSGIKSCYVKAPAHAGYQRDSWAGEQPLKESQNMAKAQIERKQSFSQRRK